ncbi:MAG: hypothetical protein MEP57_04940 [Microvirga sp.]|nr:hypothetical protein [Microvirga sp.]
MNPTQTRDITPLRFSLDETMAVRAQWLHLARFRAWAIWVILGLSILASSTIFLRLGQWELARILREFIQTAFISSALALALIWGLYRFFIPFVARRNFRQQKALAESMELSWSDDGFCYASGPSRTVMGFGDLYGYRMSDDLLLLYLSNVLYLIVPITAFDGADQRAAFVARLDAASVRRL